MTGILYGLMGGIIIGVATSALLVLNGRVTGVSGIVEGLLFPKKGDWLWRALFVAGLFSGGLVLTLFYGETWTGSATGSFASISLAGVLVGFGTILGSGCTSGHGICGMSRFSIRSLVATLTFILAGAVTVFLRGLLS